MSLLLAISALLTMQQSTDGESVISASINVPEAILPAVTPYVDCLNRTQLRLSQRAGPLHADGMRQIVMQARTDCARTRSKARAKAIRLIVRDKTIAEGERASKVDQILAGIDQSDEVFLAEVERAEKAGATANKP